MMTCQELIDFLADYVAGTLPPEHRNVFEQHLRLCPPCVDYLRMYRATIQLGKESCAGEPVSRPPMPEELKKAILEARRDKR